MGLSSSIDWKLGDSLDVFELLLSDVLSSERAMLAFDQFIELIPQFHVQMKLGNQIITSRVRSIFGRLMDLSIKGDSVDRANQLIQTFSQVALSYGITLDDFMYSKGISISPGKLLQKSLDKRISSMSDGDVDSVEIFLDTIVGGLDQGEYRGAIIEWISNFGRIRMPFDSDIEPVNLDWGLRKLFNICYLALQKSPEKYEIFFQKFNEIVFKLRSRFPLGYVSPIPVTSGSYQIH